MKPPSRMNIVCRIISVSLLFVLSIFCSSPAHAFGFLIDIPGHPNSGVFGQTVKVLPNGNFVVTDPYYPFYTDYTEAKGAVYLYSPDGVLISRLAGDRIGNSVGGGGIAVLTNGDYVVNSPFWDSLTTDGVVAVTWCSQVTGCNGTVSAANSLIGSHNGDLVGFGGVRALTNGNYVVSSPHWFNGDTMWAGAVTWGNGVSGTKGVVVSAANSLVGSHASDELGSKNWNYEGGVVTLANGNYLVLDSGWDNGSVVDAGSVTWGNGMGGTAGAVSAVNSLVGSSTGDSVGNDFWGRIIELPSSNYVVVNPNWDLDGAHQNAGAVTWGSGTSGVSGAISAANSLVGNDANSPGTPEWEVTVLTNGNYVVTNSYWSPSGIMAGWGAATWGSGIIGVSGQISASNSLVGSADNDRVGFGNFFADGGVIALTNGNYVVTSTNWNGQGAVTWGDGTSGIRGPVSISNSMVGTPNTGGTPGTGKVIALVNGNYAVSSPCWYDKTPGSTNVSAVTWGNGTTGTIGEVSTANSLIGVNTGNCLGTDGGLVALTSGNYVWNYVGIGVTWMDGSHATTGVASASNSLHGSTAGDDVGGTLTGDGAVLPLTNGNYVVLSPGWDNGSIVDAGAVTWGNGASGTTGAVSSSNSLVGSSANDRLGDPVEQDNAVTILSNGNYVVSAPQWDKGSVTDVGAVTWGNGAGGTIGAISASNSLVGSTSGDMGYDGMFYGDFKVLALPNGNYVVDSPHWHGAIGAGSVTWGNGLGGTIGEISVANSLVNTCNSDPENCLPSLTALADGSVLVQLPNWSYGGRKRAVGLVMGLPNITAGPVSTANSVLGVSASTLAGALSPAYDAARTQLIVGRPLDNKVTILRSLPNPTNWLYLPVVVK